MSNRKSETIVVLIVLLGAVVVSLPALGTGLLNDDFIHRSILAGPCPAADSLSERGLMPEGSGRLGYALSHLFVAVQPEENLQSLKAYGALPWWTYDGFRVAFWRPMASLTHWLDYRFFAQSPSAMHLHNIVWFAVAMAAVSLLYRRITSIAVPGVQAGSSTTRIRWIAAMAALLYLLDDNGFFPTMWIANRNILISLFFGVLALIAHDRYRREHWRAGAVMVPLCVLASVLATEGGVATFAYLLAYEISLGQGSLRRRALALAPGGAVIVLWRLAYNLQGYGANGGGFYLDPVREPLGYAVAVVLRGPFFLGGLWTGVPVDLYGWLPPVSKLLLWVLLAAFTVLIPVVLTPMLRTNRRARFWLIGMYVAALPVCATVPMGRAMLFIAIGAFGVVAEYIVGWWTVDRWVPSRRWMWHVCRTVFVVFLIAHVLVAAAGRITAPRVTAKMQEKMAETQDLGPAGTLEGQDLIVVNAPNPVSFLYDPFRRAWEGQSLPLGVRILAPGFNTVDVTRIGPQRLTVRSVSDSLLDCQRGKRMDFAFFYRYLGDVRSGEHPLRAGDRILLPRMQVEVLEVDGRGFPVEAAFEFDVPLEDPSLKWLQWDWDHDVYRVFPPPAQGDVVRLRGPF